MRASFVLSLACALALVTAVAGAQVQRIVKPSSARTFATHEYVPLYPGDNDLVLQGPGVETAKAVTLPPGLAESVQLRDASVDAKGLGQIATFIRIKREVHGKLTVRVTYPAGDRVDAFNARVFRRGTVRTIHAPPKTLVGQKIRVRYEGDELGVAALRAGGPAYTVKRVGGSDRHAEFDIRFKQCGTLWLGPGLLHDASVPYSEVVSGEAGYTGTTNTAVVVGTLPGQKCPEARTDLPKHLPFCARGKRWDAEQRACVPR